MINLREKALELAKDNIELQHSIAGTMPFEYFELMSQEERMNHVNDALVQMPEDILEDILSSYFDNQEKPS